MALTVAADGVAGTLLDIPADAGRQAPDVNVTGTVRRAASERAGARG